jgi:hypothetical protein
MTLSSSQASIAKDMGLDPGETLFLSHQHVTTAMRSTRNCVQTSTSTRNYGQLAIATEKLCTTGAKTNAKNETLWNAQPPQPNNLYNSATNSRSCPVSASPPALLYPYKFFITRSMSGYKAATGLRGGKTYIPNLQSTTVMGRPNFQLQVRVGVAVGANFGGSQRVILRAVDDR